MATRRTTRKRSNWLFVLVLALLAIPGFGLGFMAGIAWEEPSLLATAVLGGGEEVAWAEGESVTAPVAVSQPPRRAKPLPEVAAAPAPKAPPKTQAKPAHEAKAKPSATKIRPDVLTPGAPGPGRFAVQVGAFRESGSAEKLAGSLRQKGFPVYVSPGAKAGESRWRVRVGPWPDRDEAGRVAERLKRDEKLPTWVLDEDGAA